MALANAYLTIPGVTGSGPNGEIELDSFSFGISNSSTAGASGGVSAGNVSLSDFTITKTVDSSTPKLLDTALMGQSFPTMSLVVNKSGTSGSTGGGGETFTVMFGEVLIARYKIDDGQNHGGGTSLEPSGNNGLPMESISFNFGQLAFTFTKQSS